MLITRLLHPVAEKLVTGKGTVLSDHQGGVRISRRARQARLPAAGRT